MSEKKLQAKHLYFQSDLNKTQIADLLNISRRTLHYWIREGNWHRLKKSAEHMPSLIAENCYHIMAHMTNDILSESRLTRPPSPREIDALHKLTLTISKLKNRATLNENVEMFAYFLDKVKAKAPKIAEEIAPIVDEYLTDRASVYATDVQPPHFNEIGYIPYEHASEAIERRKDNDDFFAWDTEEFREQQDAHQNTLPDLSTNAEAQPPINSMDDLSLPMWQRMGLHIFRRTRRRQHWGVRSFEPSFAFVLPLLTEPYRSRCIFPGNSPTTCAPTTITIPTTTLHTTPQVSNICATNFHPNNGNSLIVNISHQNPPLQKNHCTNPLQANPINQANQGSAAIVSSKKPGRNSTRLNYQANL